MPYQDTELCVMTIAIKEKLILKMVTLTELHAKIKVMTVMAEDGQTYIIFVELQTAILILKLRSTNTTHKKLDLKLFIWYDIPVPKYNKRAILKRIIKIPPNQRAPFWKREFKLFNDLLEVYPNMDFWSKVNFNQEWDSLRILKSDYGKKILAKKYNEFHYILPEIKQHELGKKTGKDAIINKKPKTIRDFLS